MRKTSSIIASGLLLLVAAWANPAGANPVLYQQQSCLSGSSNAFYGYSVAVDGATAVVGAIADNGGLGAAHVMVLNNGGWTEQQKLTAPDGAADDQFGYAVAISGDRVLVGAAGKGSGQGAVYAFQRSGTVWTQQQELMQSGGQPDDCFGCALALTGSTALIAAPGAFGNLGEAFVFTSSGSAWAQQAAFLGADTSDFFAFSVALSPDGNDALVGAFGSASQQGSAYLFTRSGTAWSQQTVLTAPDGQAGDRFGYAVAMGSGTALIGAYAKGPGVAYVFSGSGSTWSKQTELTEPAPTGSDAFGSAVALDGNTALIGAYENGANRPGAAYAFTGSGASWSAPQVLPANGSNQYFGYSVAAGGGSAVIGAFGAANDSGLAYLFASTGPGAPSTLVPALGGSAWLAGLVLVLGVAGALALRPRHGGRAS